MAVGLLAALAMPSSLTNLYDSVTYAMLCSTTLRVSVVSFALDTTVSLVAASAVLTLHTLSRARRKRELFYWATTLDVSGAVDTHTDTHTHTHIQTHTRTPTHTHT